VSSTEYLSQAMVSPRERPIVLQRSIVPAGPHSIPSKTSQSLLVGGGREEIDQWWQDLLIKYPLPPIPQSIVARRWDFREIHKRNNHFLPSTLTRKSFFPVNGLCSGTVATLGNARRTLILRTNWSPCS
jgi:hypothetical protein